VLHLFVCETCSYAKERRQIEHFAEEIILCLRIRGVTGGSRKIRSEKLHHFILNYVIVLQLDRKKSEGNIPKNRRR
jgi:hypothetical protein